MKFINENLNTCNITEYINRQMTMNMFFEAKEKFQRASVTVKEYLSDPEKYDAEYSKATVYSEIDKGSKKKAGHIFYICPSFTVAYNEGITTLLDSLKSSDFGDVLGFSVVLACADGFIEISFKHYCDHCNSGDKVVIINPESKYPKFLRFFMYDAVHVLTNAADIKKLAKDAGYKNALATGYPGTYGENNCVCKLVVKEGTYTHWDNENKTTYIDPKDISTKEFAMKALKTIIDELHSSEKCKKVIDTIGELADKGVERKEAQAAEKVELKSGEAKQPFNSKEELMAVIDEIGKSKTVMKEFEGKSAKIWEKISKIETQIAKELEKSGLSISDDYEAWKAKEAELEKKYGLAELRKQDDDLLANPDYKAASDTVYTKCAKRLEDSLSKAELKKIGKRNGYMYNLMGAVIQKYSGWDPRKK